MSYRHHNKLFNEQEYHLSIILFIVTNRNRNNYTHQFLGLVETDLIMTIRNTLVHKMCFAVFDFILFLILELNTNE